MRGMLIDNGNAIFGFSDYIGFMKLGFGGTKQMIAGCFIHFVCFGLTRGGRCINW